MESVPVPHLTITLSIDLDVEYYLECKNGNIHPSVVLINPENIFIADNAAVIGNVTLGDEVNIWYGSVIRADMHYIKTFRVPDGKGGETSRGTNLYWPEPKNDTFEYHPNDTIYQARREEINGTNNHGGTTIFETLWQETLNEIFIIKAAYNDFMGRKSIEEWGK